MEQDDRHLPLEHLQVITKIANALLSLKRAEDLLKTINESAKQMLDAERCTIFLHDEATGELYSTVASELEISEIRIPLGKGIVGTVAQEERIINITKAYKDPRFDSRFDRMTGFQTRSILTVPLCSQDNRLLGVYQVLNKRNGVFTRLDEELALMLASFIVIALENSRLYSELEKAHQSLVRLEEMKNKFINIASHELLTPITILQGYMGVMSSGMLFPVTEAHSEPFQKAEEQIDRLTSLVRNIINVSELEYHVRSPDIQSIDTREFFSQFRDAIKPFSDKRKQHFQLTIDASVPSSFSGDSVRLQQALHNIAMNAVKYTKDGGEITVNVSCADEISSTRDTGVPAKSLRISISDTGIGMEPEELEHIFKTFYEVQDPLYHSSGTFEFKAGGLGLGLPIAKKIVENHCGSITVQSTPGAGSTFTVILPFHKYQ